MEIDKHISTCIFTFEIYLHCSSDMLISALRVSFVLCIFEFVRVEILSDSKLFNMLLASRMCMSRPRAAFREPPFGGSALTMP